MKSKNTTIIVVALLFLIVTFGSYFLLNIERTKVSNWSLALIVASELIFFWGLIVASSKDETFKGPFAKIGFIAVLALYLVAHIITMAILGRTLKSLNTLFLAAILINAIAMVLLALVRYFSKRFYAEERADLATDVMRIGEHSLHTLLSNHGKDSTAPALKKLFEAFKYSEKGVITGHDGELLKAIKVLENSFEDEDEVRDAALSRVESLVEQRNYEVSQKKRGGT